MAAPTGLPPMVSSGSMTVVATLAVAQRALMNASSTALRRGKNTPVSAGDSVLAPSMWVKPFDPGQVSPPPSGTPTEVWWQPAQVWVWRGRGRCWW